MGYSPSFLHYGRRIGFPAGGKNLDCTDPRVLGARLEEVGEALQDAMVNTAHLKDVFFERQQKHADAEDLRVVTPCLLLECCAPPIL